jgi:hypothetical protein
LDTVLQRTGNLASHVASPVAFTQITGEIGSGRPPAVRVRWIGGGGHFVVVRCYGVDGRPKTNTVRIEDPWYGPWTGSFQQFRTAYRGTGKWTHTYMTKTL